MENQFTVIAENIKTIWKEAGLESPMENSMSARIILNPPCLQKMDERHALIKRFLEEARADIFN